MVGKEMASSCGQCVDHIIDKSTAFLYNDDSSGLYSHKNNKNNSNGNWQLTIICRFELFASFYIINVYAESADTG